MANELAVCGPEKAPAFLAQLKPALTPALAGKVRESLFCCALTSFRRNPKLMLCKPESIIGALLMAGQSGLMPDNGLQHAWLVPYGTECTFISGYKGLVDVAYRSGQIASIYAEVVREGDSFAYAMGLNPRLEHTPAPGKKGKLTHAYAVAKTVQGGAVFTVMESDEVMAIKRRSRSAQSSFSPWNGDDEPEMWKKTALRRLCKELPASVVPQAVASVLEREDAQDFQSARQAEVIIHNPAPLDDGGAGVESGEMGPAVPQQPSGQEQAATKPTPIPPAPPAAPPPPSACISEPQRKRFYAILLKGSKGQDDKDARTAAIKDWMMANLGHAHSEQIARNDYERTCDQAAKIAEGFAS